MPYPQNEKKQISNPVKDIANIMINKVHFTSKLKQANFTPIYKKDDHFIEKTISLLLDFQPFWKFMNE